MPGPQRSDLIANLRELTAEARTRSNGSAPCSRAVASGMRLVIRRVKEILGRDKRVLVFTAAEVRELRELIQVEREASAFYEDESILSPMLASIAAKLDPED